MKKVYEAPEMLIEAVCVEEMLAASGLPVIGGGDDSPKVGDLGDILTKDRKDDFDLW